MRVTPTVGGNMNVTLAPNEFGLFRSEGDSATTLFLDIDSARHLWGELGNAIQAVDEAPDPNGEPDGTAVGPNYNKTGIVSPLGSNKAKTVLTLGAYTNGGKETEPITFDSYDDAAELAKTLTDSGALEAEWSPGKPQVAHPWS